MAVQSTEQETIMARKLRDLSRLPPDNDDLRAINKVFKEEHPIVAAILGAGLIEHRLDQLLRSRLKHKDDQTWATLTEAPGPLNSFSSKITMGYALGIYDQRMRADLNIIRSIRNAFAHSKKVFQFDHPLVVKELSKATRSALPKKHSKFPAQYRYGILCMKLTYKLAEIHYRPSKAKLKRDTKALRLRLKALKADELSPTQAMLGIVDK
jgi:hypothetical protein